MFERIKVGPVSVSDLVSWLDKRLDDDDDLSQALVPEVWRVERKDAVICAMRLGEVSVVAPFRYASLLWALALGYLVWGDIPNALAWLGIVLLIGAGLSMIHHQRISHRRVIAASRIEAPAPGAPPEGSIDDARAKI